MNFCKIIFYMTVEKVDLELKLAVWWLVLEHSKFKSIICISLELHQTITPIHYSNSFMHKHNRFPWQPEFYVMSRYGDLQYSFQISNRLHS